MGRIIIAVDTHFDRVSNRIKFAMDKNVVEVENKLIKVVQKEFNMGVRHRFILHSHSICVALKPKFGSLIIEELYEFKDKIEYCFDRSEPKVNKIIKQDERLLPIDD